MRASFSDRIIFRALLFGSLLAAYEPTVGLDTDDLLFYAPFDGSLDASYSNGDPRASVVTQEAYAFKDGIRGQAVVFGGRGDESKSHAVLSYKTDGNILPTHGTIAFWSQPIDWLDFGLDGRYYTWMSIGVVEPKPGNWSLYRDGGGGNTGLWLDMGGKLFWTPSYLPTWEWPKGGNLWQHIAFTWQPGEVRYYLNGNLLGRYSEDVPLVTRFVESMNLGRDDPWKVAVDELYLFKRALTNQEISAVYRLGKEPLGVKRIATPIMTSPPKIDGKLTHGEWNEACVVDGFVNGTLGLQANESVQTYVAYDERCLYLALKYAIPERVRKRRQLFPNGALRRRMTTRDADLRGDDHYEVTIAPDCTGPRYRLRLNALGSLADDQDGDMTWNSTATVASFDDEDVWTVEIAVPFSDVSLETPTEGRSFGLSIKREWRVTSRKWAALALGGGERVINVKKPDTSFERHVEQGQPPKSYDILRGGDVVGLTEMVLSGRAPYVRLAAIESPSHGELKVGGFVVNPGSSTSGRIATAVSDLFASDEILSLPQNTAAPFEITGKLTTEAAATLAIKASTAKHSLYEASIPFSYSSPLRVEHAFIASKDLLRLTVYPGLEATQGLVANARILHLDETTTSLAAKRAALSTEGPSTIDFDVATLNANEFKVYVSLDADGKRVAERTTPFVKRQRPPWFANQLGQPTSVPLPWTPVKARDTHVSVWGRTYHFGDGVLFSQIESAENELLSGPMRIAITKDGTSHNVNASVARCISKNDLEAVIETEGKAGPVSVQAQTRIEFDGFTWTTLTFTPRENTVTELDAVTIDVPFKPERSTLYYVGDYTSRVLGAIKPWKSGAFGFQWLGDECAGLQWYAQSDKGWWNKKKEGQVEIIPGEKENLLRLNLMTERARFEKPVKIELGFIATPVTLKRPDWRHFTWSWFAGEKNRRLLLWFTSWAQGVSWPLLKPIDDPVWQTHASHRADGIVPHLYLGGATSSPFSPDYSLFQEEWRPVPSRRHDIDAMRESSDSGGDGVRVEICPASSYQDFIVYYLDKAVREQERDIQGFYFDNTWPTGCMNEHHGCGYVDADGERHPEFPILRTREMFKRIYVAMKTAKPEAMLSFHMSAQPLMPMLSFADVWLDGEQFASGLVRHASQTGVKGFHDYLTLDRFRAAFMGHQWGGQLTFLLSELWALIETGNEDSAFAYWQGGDRDIDRMAEHLSGMQVLHDAYPSGGTNVSLVLLGVQKEFGWDEKTEFLPYWNNRQYIAIDSNGVEPVVCSIFRRENKLMLMLFNDSDEEANVNLKLNFEELGVTRTVANILRDPIGYNQHGGGGFPRESARYVALALRRFHSETPERLKTHGNHEGLFLLVEDRATVPVMKRNYRLLLVE